MGVKQRWANLRAWWDVSGVLSRPGEESYQLVGQLLRSNILSAFVRLLLSHYHSRAGSWGIRVIRVEDW